MTHQTLSLEKYWKLFLATLSGHPRDFEKWSLNRGKILNWIGEAVNMILRPLYSKILLKNEHI